MEPNLGLFIHISKANILRLSCGEEKCRVYFHTRNLGQLMLKNLNFLMDFEKAFLKAGRGRGVSGCVVSLCTIL